MTQRRRFLSHLSLAAAAAGAGAATPAATAATTPPKPKTDRLPGDPPEHHVVYQLNRADPEYIEHILNSVGAMIGKYEDNVAIVVVAFGPGVHLLARQPKRPIAADLRERARAQAKNYSVRYIACGNTMKTIGWGPADMVDFAQVEEVGAAVLMELQEQGYAYIAW